MMNIRQKAKYGLFSLGSQTSIFTFILVLSMLIGCKSNSVVTNEGISSDTNEGLTPLSTLLSRPRPSSFTNNRTIEEMTYSDPVKEENKVAVTGLKRLPTLREQMSEITDNQQQVLTATDSVLGQLHEIRSDLEIIKQTLILNPKPSEKKENSAKPKEKIKADNKKTSDDIILPDDKVETSKKQPSSAKKNNQSSVTDIKKKDNPSEQKPLVAEEDNTSLKQDTKTDSITGSSYRNALRLISRREYAQAIPYLQSAIAKPENAATKLNAQYWLGEAMFATGNYEQALTQFTMILNQKNSSKLDDAMIMMGETYYKQGRKDEAVKTFNKLIATFPTSEFIPRARKRLQQL